MKRWLQLCFELGGGHEMKYRGYHIQRPRVHFVLLRTRYVVDLSRSTFLLRRSFFCSNSSLIHITMSHSYRFYVWTDSQSVGLYRFYVDSKHKVTLASYKNHDHAGPMCCHQRALLCCWKGIAFLVLHPRGWSWNSCALKAAAFWLGVFIKK